MNTKQIQYALALSETLNFSQVADQLGITQPALSKQIQHLEKELGVKLFDRNHNPLRLTGAGAHFMQEAQKLVYSEQQLLRSMEQFRSSERGELVIGVTPFRSLYILPDVVKQLRQRYPGVKVTLKEMGSEQLRKSAAEGNVDLAVVNLPVDESVLEVYPMEADQLVLAVPKEMTQHISTASEDGQLGIKACGELPFVVVGKQQEMRQLFDKLCAQDDFTPNIGAEVVGISTAWAMALAGVGATLLPLQFIKSKQFNSNLELYTIRNCTYIRQPAVVTRRGQYLPEYARCAIQLLTGSENI